MEFAIFYDLQLLNMVKQIHQNLGLKCFSLAFYGLKSNLMNKFAWLINYN